MPGPGYTPGCGICPGHSPHRYTDALPYRHVSPTVFAAAGHRECRDPQSADGRRVDHKAPRASAPADAALGTDCSLAKPWRPSGIPGGWLGRFLLHDFFLRSNDLVRQVNPFQGGVLLGHVEI